ncbi:FMRFamide receptor [Biomphalaria pfeifferi]|uniref:FMRFamide receptor n=1 Tax=Biomphalaria pfeifferi TaxID=112525 RepID=A0AAD8F579_BIOPF|nr:FMRFamide receptor [Biomphalaria pfeifferi]
MSSSIEVNLNTNFSFTTVFNLQSLDVSDFTTTVFELVNLTILTSIICFLGIPLNVLNIVVFLKQGMKSTVNISLLALSITDLINILLIGWVCISSYTFWSNSQDIAILPREISYLTGGFPHGCMSRIAAWITVYMTAERCLCIALPFKIKTLITPRLTVIVLIIIYIFSIVPLVPEYLFFKLDWKYSSQLNKLIIGLVPNLDQLHLEGVSFLSYSVMTVTSFLTVICLTLILILQLRKMSLWRSTAQGSLKPSKSLTQRDQMAIRTVLVVACVLIITFTPSFIFCGVCFIVPGFALTGPLSNSYIIFISFAFLFDATNASINTVLYCTMNRSYRETFKTLFGISSAPTA